MDATPDNHPRGILLPFNQTKTAPAVPPALRHPELNRSEQQIRLLRLHEPVHGINHRIQGRLHTFDLDSAPAYSALSYVWGSQDPSRQIFVNDSLLKVGPNLYHFLCEFERSCNTDYQIWLWADQICIDQNNTAEKNHQVRMMADIYSRAKETIVWLAEDVPASTLDPLGPVGDSKLAAALAFLQSKLHAYGGLPDAEREEKIQQEFDEASDLWVTNAATIFNNLYFTRLWVVQEVLLADTVRVLLQGGTLIPWDKLTELYDLLFLYDLPSIRYMRNYFGDNSRNSKHKDLVDCLLRYIDLHCEDPRDKVYGLMGIVLPEQRITVDYDKSVQEVMLDVARQWLRFGDLDYDLQYLCYRFNLDTNEANGWTELTGALDFWYEDQIEGQDAQTRRCRVDSITLGFRASAGSQSEGHTDCEASDAGEACWWYRFEGQDHCFPCRARSSSSSSTECDL